LGTLESGGLQSEVLVAEGTPSRIIDQCAIAVAPDGTIAVVWYEVMESQHLWRYRAQRFSSSLVPLGDAFSIRRGSAPYHGSPLAVAALGDDEFAVAYSESASAGGGVVRLQHLEAGGLVGLAQVVVADPTIESTRPRLSTNAAGALVVTWRSLDSQSGSVWSEYAVLDANLQVVAPPQMLPATNADRPSVDAAGDHFAITWEASNGYNDDVYTRVYRFTDGEPVSPAQRLNTHLAGHQDRPDISLVESALGLVGVVVWEGGDDQDGDGRGVFARAWIW